MGSVYSMDMLDKGMINIPGGTEWDEARFHHVPQNTSQFKNMDCLFPGFVIYYLLTTGR